MTRTKKKSRRAASPAPRTAVIGGSGVYALESLQDVSVKRIKTPFGSPSDAITIGSLGGVRCAFLPRHGRGHVLLPTEVPSRANIWALKSLGVERVISISSVGSLREELPPRVFVFPDQLVDETRHRNSTFFGDGVVAHVSLAHPFCSEQNVLTAAAAAEAGIKHRSNGTYACMEGPQFSTRAESLMHRQLGYDLIGMTAAGEAKLAREAELCYTAVAMVTDYDCWKDDDHVTAEKVIEHLTANAANARRLLALLLPRLDAAPRGCPCPDALKDAVFTRPEMRSKKTLKKLGPIMARFKESRP